MKPTLGAFLSSIKTKHHLTLYLAEKAIQRYLGSQKTCVVSTTKGISSAKPGFEHLQTSQEEADTILILHALNAKERGKNVCIFSPDADVLILALSCAEKLGDTVVIIGKKGNKRNIPIDLLDHKLGNLKAKALLGFHAFTGTDTSGHFEGKGKLKCYNACIL